MVYDVVQLMLLLLVRHVNMVARDVGLVQNISAFFNVSYTFWCFEILDYANILIYSIKLFVYGT